MHADPIDDIYEATFLPERWASVLGGLKTLSHSASAALILYDDDVRSRDVVSCRVMTEAPASAPAIDWAASVRLRHMLSARPTRFVPVDSFVSAEESAADPVWARLRAEGRCWQLCTLIPMPGGAAMGIVAERGGVGYTAQEIAKLDELRPHLARAGLVSTRLSLSRAKNAVDVLARIGFAAAILTSQGRACALNERFEALSPGICCGVSGRLTVRDQRSHRRFDDALAQMRDGGGGGVSSLPLTSGSGREAAIIHLVPLSGTARALFEVADLLLIVTAPNDSGPSAAILSGLFDLTPAESRLACHLIRGVKLAEIASATGVSITTLRSQLSAVFAKTSTNRQPELLSLLSSIWTPPLRAEPRHRILHMKDAGARAPGLDPE